MALAIVIAEYIVKLAIQPSNEIRGVLGAAASSSGELALFVGHPEDRRDYFGIQMGSENLYFSWQRLCERCLKEIAGESPESDKTIRWPSEQALVKYWQTIDRFVPDLLNYPTLIAIRET